MLNTHLNSKDNFNHTPMNFTGSYCESLATIDNQIPYGNPSFNSLTTLSSNKNKNYKSLLYKCVNLEDILKSLYCVESNPNKVLDFIITKQLFDIVLAIPNKIFEYFNEFILDLQFKVKYDDEKLLNVIISTNYDGSLASNLVDKVNEYFVEYYKDDFMNNFLISAEPL